MADRPRDLGDFNRVGRCVNLRLNFRSNRYVSRQYPRTVSWGMVILQFVWSFHTKKLCSRQYSIKIEFTPSTARWKARSRLPIRHNWTFFARPISYGWDVISGNLSKSAFFEGQWVTSERKFQTEGDVARQPLLVCHKARMWQTDRRTDRWTDGQTELRLPRPH